jgi:hypothetical protein
MLVEDGAAFSVAYITTGVRKIGVNMYRLYYNPKPIELNMAEALSILVW